MFIVFTRLFRPFPIWNGFRMFQISAMININTKFEGSTNRPCAKRNEEQQELRRVCELQSKLFNFGLFFMVAGFRFVFFFFSMQTWLFWGAFLWRIRIRISDLWRSLRSKSIFRSVIYQIHSGQGSSDHWFAWSKDGSLDHSSITFLWAKDPKLIILPSGAQFETSGYFIYWPERLLAITPQILR